MILFVDDLEDYTREFTFQLDDSPHMIAYDQKELMKLLDGLTPEKAAQNDKDLIAFWGIYETGTASERVADVIMEHVNSI